MERSIIKFSSEDCGTCHRMSHYDASVSKELGLTFIDVPMQDTAIYRKYRKILLEKYPNKEGMGWPTYLIIDGTLDVYKIIGEVKSVSGDVLVNQTNGQAFFRSRIEIDKSERAKLGDIKLTAGMPAEVLIQTGNRTAMEYLLKPMTDALVRGLNED